MLIGKRPYNGRDRKSIREEMLGREAKIPASFNHKISKEGIDFVNKVPYLSKLRCFRGHHERGWDTTASPRYSHTLG